MIVLFSVSALLATIIKNYYTFYAYKLVLKIRKTLICAMYEKVGRLSIGSMEKRISSKISTMISNEFFGLEKGLTVSPVLISSIFINAVGLVLIWLILDEWYFVITVLICWFCMMIAQWAISPYANGGAKIIGKINDKSLHLWSEIITGIKHIKCHGWESYYLA